MGVFRSDRPGDDQERCLVIGAVAGTPPARPSLQMFELRCADVHPVRCDKTMSSADCEDLVAIARKHGAGAHGFTSVWYSAARLAAMAEAVRTR
jgi:hypothetical protein